MFRNFISTLRHFAMASSLNIIGLSVAFAAFLVIIMQVRYELNFDKCHKNYDRIYKAEIAYGGNGQTVVSRAFTNALGECSPMVESYTLIEPSWGKRYLTVERNGSKVGFNDYVSHAYPAFKDVFNPTMLEGTADAVNEPKKMLIPSSIAHKYFGDESALDKQIMAGESVYVVGGVFEDFPENSQISNVIYIKIPDDDGKNDDGSYAWGMNNYMMYLTLVPGADPRALETEFNSKFNLDELSGYTTGGKAILTPITELYYLDRAFAIEHLIKHGDRDTTNVMIAIALLILVIAAINFVNFSTSLAPLRMKSINIQKVLGSLNGKLRATLIFEAVGLCIVSFGISILIVYLMSNSSLQDITLSGISLEGNWSLVALTALVALLLGLFAGIYPAFYTTKFPPVMVIKGSFAMSPRGRMLRTLLIGFQFVVSIGLITASLFLQLQTRYMRSMDTGIDKDNIAIVELGGQLKGNKFRTELLKNSMIKDVAHSQFNIAGSNMSQGWGRDVRDNMVQFDAHLVSWNFADVMGLKMVEGRNFTESEEANTEDQLFIFNETAAKQYSITIDDKVDDRCAIVGIVKDFNSRSLHYNITPVALVLYKDASSWLPFAYIKVNGNPFQAADYIRKAAAQIDPAYPIDVQFYDQTFNNFYQKERKTAQFITLFSVIAVIISLVGVFGLVVFETQYRRKEIGLRRINGATIGTILVMFNRKFVVLVAVCFAIAVPLAWYGVDSWLSSFAYRTPIYWWVFGVSLLIVASITVLTVTVQSWRAATENPVKSLKAE